MVDFPFTKCGRPDYLLGVQSVLTAFEVAEWFVNWADAGEEPSDVTNLKLQKLLYYAQGHHLGSNGQPLFAEDIQAWSHGPVVPLVYRKFKSFQNAPVSSLAESFDWADYSDEDSEFLATVWNTYGKFSAWQLRNMTHAESPWIDHFVPDERFIGIPVESLKSHFAPLHSGR